MRKLMIYLKLNSKIKVINLIFLLMAALNLAGCRNGGFQDRAEEYKCTRTYPELEIPKGIHAERFQDNYTIPSIP